jgi:glutathionylspermidine synthase
VKAHIPAGSPRTRLSLAAGLGPLRTVLAAADKMRRQVIAPRADFAAKLELQGLSFHARDAYWKEDACYRFDLSEIEAIEAATNELHGLCVEALKVVVSKERLGQLAIPQAFWDPIAASLKRKDFSLYGRFDFSYDGRNAPKMLEYNADTPTSLLESAVCQWFWMKDKFPAADQFNSIHERLIARWRELPGNNPIHLACLADNEEDWACAAYLQDTVVQADRAAIRLDIEQIGWDPARNSFVDLQGDEITHLFKLYPWEWLMREDFGAHLAQGRTQMIEPMWKAVLSCKGLLPILWGLYPDHPNLLPAYFEKDRLRTYAKKPLYSREGANIELFSGNESVGKSDGPYGEQGFVYQGLQQLRCFDGHYPVIGSWVVNGESAGMCIREDSTPITTNTSSFVPHYFD